MRMVPERWSMIPSNDAGPLIYTKWLCKAGKAIVVSVERISCCDFQIPTTVPHATSEWSVYSPLLLFQNNSLPFFMGTGYVSRFK